MRMGNRGACLRDIVDGEQKTKPGSGAHIIVQPRSARWDKQCASEGITTWLSWWFGSRCEIYLPRSISDRRLILMRHSLTNHHACCFLGLYSGKIVLIAHRPDMKDRELYSEHCPFPRLPSSGISGATKSLFVELSKRLEAHHIIPARAKKES
jgi:hypothetical protein